MLNLLLCGVATSNVFDGSKPMGDTGLTLKGIPSQAAVGYLTHLEALRYCQVKASRPIGAAHQLPLPAAHRPLPSPPPAMAGRILLQDALGARVGGGIAEPFYSALCSHQRPHP